MLWIIIDDTHFVTVSYAHILLLCWVFVLSLKPLVLNMNLLHLVFVHDSDMATGVAAWRSGSVVGLDQRS